MNVALSVVNYNSPCVNVCLVTYSRSVSLYFKCIKFNYIILLLTIFLSTLYENRYILLNVAMFLLLLIIRLFPYHVKRSMENK
jgi:hypothetical protein